MKKYFYSFAFIFITLFVLAACNNAVEDSDKGSDSNVVSKDANTETIEADYPPMVMVDGHVYQDMGYVNSAVTCGTADGKITSSVEGSKLPGKDNESNFGEGNEYQFWDKSHINVKMDGKWMIFQNVAISSWKIPSGVANFKAKVIEALEDRLLVAVIDIPEDFKWIFQNKEIATIKPISLTIENLVLDENKKVETKNLIGKTVQVWFDGSIKNDEPEMSYPIELGEIYRITSVEE